MKVKESQVKYLAGQVNHARCLEPVGKCLIQHLMVPKIYFERSWAKIYRPDVIAVDRAGTGDIHVVEIKQMLKEALELAEKVMLIPAHYKWVAYQGEGLREPDVKSARELLSQRPLLPDAGMGRVGVIEVIQMEGNNLGARIRLNAERFKAEGIWKMADKFVGKEEADYEYREERE